MEDDDDGNGFLNLLFQRRPELAELLVCNSGPPDVPEPGSGCAKRSQKSAPAFASLFGAGERRASGSACGPRKLSLKAHIEGLPWIRPEGRPQTGEPSALAAAASDEAGMPVEAKAPSDSPLGGSEDGISDARPQGGTAVTIEAKSGADGPPAQQNSEHCSCNGARGVAGTEAAVVSQHVDAASHSAAEKAPHVLLDCSASYCGSWDSGAASSSAATTHSGGALSIAGSTVGHEAEHDLAGGSGEAEDTGSAGPFAAALENASTAATSGTAAAVGGDAAAADAAATGPSLNIPQSPCRPMTPSRPMTPGGGMSPSGRRLMSRGHSVSPMPSLVMQFNGSRVSARELLSAGRVGSPFRAGPGAGGGAYMQPVRGGTPTLCGPPPARCSTPDPASLSRKPSLQPILLLPPLPPAPAPRNLASVHSLVLLQRQQQRQQQEQRGQGEGLEEEDRPEQERLHIRLPDPLCMDHVNGGAGGASLDGGADAMHADASVDGLRSAGQPALVEMTPWSKESVDDINCLLGTPLPRPPLNSRAAALCEQLQQLNQRLRRTASSPEQLPAPAEFPFQPHRTSVSSPSRLPAHDCPCQRFTRETLTDDGAHRGDTAVRPRAHSAVSLSSSGAVRTLGPLRSPAKFASVSGGNLTASAILQPNMEAAGLRATGNGPDPTGALPAEDGRAAAGGAVSDNETGSGGCGSRGGRGVPVARAISGTGPGGGLPIAKQTLQLPLRRHVSQQSSLLGAMPARGPHHRGSVAPLLAFHNRRQGQQPQGLRHDPHRAPGHAARLGSGDGDAGDPSQHDGVRGAVGRGAGHASARVDLDLECSDSGAVEEALKRRRRSQAAEREAKRQSHVAEPPPNCTPSPLSVPAPAASPRALPGGLSGGDARHVAPGNGSAAPFATAPPSLPALTHHGGPREATAVQGLQGQSVRGHAVNTVRQQIRGGAQHGAPSPPRCEPPERHRSGTDGRVGGTAAASCLGGAPTLVTDAPTAFSDAATAVPKLRHHRFGARSPAANVPVQQTATANGSRSIKPCDEGGAGRMQNVLPSINTPTGTGLPPRKCALHSLAAVAAPSFKTG